MNEIDDIFKEAAQAEQATFKPEYWDQYAEQFSGGNKKKKGAFWYFLGGLFISGIVLISLNYNIDSKDNITSVRNINTDSNNELYTNDIQSIETDNINLEAINALSINDNQRVVVSNSILTSNNNRLEEIIENKNNTNQSEIISNTNQIYINEVKDNSIADNNTVEYIDSEQSNDKTISSIVENNDIIEKDANVENQLVNNDTEKVQESVVDSIEVENEIANEANDSVPDEPAKPSKKQSTVKRSKINKFQINVQFGAIAYNDFNLSQNITDIKTGLYAGLEVEYRLQPNLTVSLGVNGYNRLSDGLYINFESIDNGFGEVNSKKTYSYSNLYFAEVPININYSLNSKHRIGVGPTFTRLLTTKVNVIEEIKDAQSNSNTMSVSNEYLYHYNTFKLNNVGVNITYQYMFNRVGFNIGYTHGLNEFLNKETFNSIKLNSLSKLNFSIKYRL